VPTRHPQIFNYSPATRSRRLHLFLDAYGYRDDRAGFGAAVARRARRNAEVMRHMEDTGDPVYGGQLPMIEDLEQAARDIDALPASFWRHS
jgi:hypothetical protein